MWAKGSNVGNFGQNIHVIEKYRLGVNPTESSKRHPDKCWVSTQPIKHAARKAFTLIELLVVVLIIGILAAVALPQYQRAVEKSRAATIFAIVRTLSQAERVYYLANGNWPIKLTDLDVDIEGWTLNDNKNEATKGKQKIELGGADWAYSIRGWWNTNLHGFIEYYPKTGNLVCWAGKTDQLANQTCQSFSSKQLETAQGGRYGYILN